jgi:hypothetical protein
LRKLRFVFLLAVLATVALPFWVGGKEKDMGRGEELTNVEVMDPKMRVADARIYMMTFNEALGVQCRDCHDLRDFASDKDLEMKLEARRMMKMTKAINDQWFAGKEQVSCFTCHGGKLKPATFLPGGTIFPDTAGSKSASPSK